MSDMRYRTRDGWSVEIVSLTETPDHHDGKWMRVTYFGSWVADVRTPEELAHYFPLAELEPVEPGSLMGLMSSVRSYQPTEPSSCRNWTSHVMMQKEIRCRIGSSSLCHAGTRTGTHCPAVFSTSASGCWAGTHSPDGSSAATRMGRGPILRGGNTWPMAAGAVTGIRDRLACGCDR